MRKFLVILIAVLSLHLTLWAHPQNMVVEHYTADQGLPNNAVNSALKDKDGFMWFGTWYGLCSFDGAKFKSYTTVNLGDSDVPPRKIQRIVEDKNGFIWIKTIDRKLFIFNKINETFRAVYDDVKSVSENIQIIKLQTTPNGDILLLTRDKNLLLATTDSEGNISIKVLFASNDEIDTHNYRSK